MLNKISFIKFCEEDSTRFEKGIILPYSFLTLARRMDGNHLNNKLLGFVTNGTYFQYFPLKLVNALLKIGVLLATGYDQWLSNLKMVHGFSLR